MGTDATEFVGDRSRGWIVGYATTVGGGVAAGAAGLARGFDVEALALAVVLLLMAVWLRDADRRAPRSVRASAEGVSVMSPARDQDFAWEEVRRVRTAGGHGLPAHDTYLDLVGGALVALPRKLPAGTVERWRAELAGSRPGPGLPDTWRRTDGSFSWPQFASVCVVSMSTQVAARMGLGVLGIAAVAVGMFLAVVVFWILYPLQSAADRVTADETGIRFGRGDRRRVLWSDVAAVRALDAWQDIPVLERHDGSVVKVAGPPVSIVRGWRESSRRP